MGPKHDSSRGPRAVIHKRILDVAEARPDATLAGIAEEVSGANAELVEQVLSEYGDPGEASDEDADSEGVTATGGTDDDSDRTETAQDGASGSTGNSGQTAAVDGGTRVEDTVNDSPAESTGDVDAGPAAASASTEDSPDSESEESGRANADGAGSLDLSEKQRRALRVVRANPGATQAAVAEELDVTRATVSRWLGDIPGFEWADRRAFVESVFDEGTEIQVTGTDHSDTASAASETTAATDGDEQADAEAGAGDGTDDRIAALEDRLAALESDTGSAPDISADLAHRVVHACMESERISEDEELELLAAFMQSDGE